jgi:hypothetical protein
MMAARSQPTMTLLICLAHLVLSATGTAEQTAVARTDCTFSYSQNQPPAQLVFLNCQNGRQLEGLPALTIFLVTLGCILVLLACCACCWCARRCRRGDHESAESEEEHRSASRARIWLNSKDSEA